jgi:hypothetical protein
VVAQRSLFVRQRFQVCPPAGNSFIPLTRQIFELPFGMSPKLAIFLAVMFYHSFSIPGNSLDPHGFAARPGMAADRPFGTVTLVEQRIHC